MTENIQTRHLPAGQLEGQSQADLDYGLRWDYGTYQREQFGRYGDFSRPRSRIPRLSGRPGATDL